MILVTGATGFLGSELCKQLLHQGKDVLALKRPTSIIPASLNSIKGLTWVNSSILSLEEFGDYTHLITEVYHCAAMVSFNPKDDDEMLNFNINSTIILAEFCLKNKIPMLHVSSVATLDGANSLGFTDENFFPSKTPDTHPYGISKYLSELEIWNCMNKGLNAIIVNPSIILGYTKNFEGSGAFFKIIKNGLKFYTPGGAGFVAVEDVAKCMILLMQQKAYNERFIINAENISYKQFFESIANALKVVPPSIKAGKFALGLAWRFSKLVAFFSNTTPTITKHTAKSSFNISKYDNRKIVNLLGIEFISINTYIKTIASKYTHE